MISHGFAALVCDLRSSAEGMPAGRAALQGMSRCRPAGHHHLMVR
jgi:hypothetical protein